MTSERAQASWAEVLRRLKAECGTYPEIGKAVGVHENSVQGWITQGRLPDQGAVDRIVGVLGLEAEPFEAAIARLRADQFRRRIHLHPLAPEVAGSRPFRRPQTRGGSGTGHQARPAGARTAKGVKKPRGKGTLGLITAAALAFGVPAYAQNPSHRVPSNYAISEEASSVESWSDRRRKAA